MSKHLWCVVGYSEAAARPHFNSRKLGRLFIYLVSRPRFLLASDVGMFARDACRV